MMWVGVMMIKTTRMSGRREERLQGLCPMTPTVSPLHRHLVTLNAPTLHTALHTVQFTAKVHQYFFTVKFSLLKFY